MDTNNIVGFSLCKEYECKIYGKTIVYSKIYSKIIDSIFWREFTIYGKTEPLL